MEKVQIKQTQLFTDHLNTADSARNFDLKHVEAYSRTLAFQNMNVHLKDEGSMNVAVYRKPSQTDQYLLWAEHIKKVFRTLYKQTIFINAMVILGTPYVVD